MQGDGSAYDGIEELLDLARSLVAGVIDPGDAAAPSGLHCVSRVDEDVTQGLGW